MLPENFFTRLFSPAAKFWVGDLFEIPQGMGTTAGRCRILNLQVFVLRIFLGNGSFRINLFGFTLFVAWVARLYFVCLMGIEHITTSISYIIHIIIKPHIVYRF